MRRIPIRPVTTSIHGEFPADIVVSELHRAHGQVIDAAAVARFAAAHGIRERYVRDALGLHTELGLLEQPRRDLWLPTGCDASIEEAIRAHAACRILGPWSHPVGVWAMLLRGVLQALPAQAIRACATPKPTKLRTQHGTTGCTGRPVPTARRHATELLGHPVAVIARPVEVLTPCDWLDADCAHVDALLGVHVERPADALVTMLEHPRLNGGVDVALRVVGRIVRDEGLQAIVDAARRTRFTSTRRRVAFALEAAQRADPEIDRCIMRDPRVAPCTLDAWLNNRLPQLLTLPTTSRPCLLDPHRRRDGPVVRRLGLVDNRRATLQLRRVTVPVHRTTPGADDMRSGTRADAHGHSDDLPK